MGFVGALAAAAVALIAVLGFPGTGGQVDVHRVDTSPQDIREFWTPERMEKARQGDPMPVIVEE